MKGKRRTEKEIRKIIENKDGKLLELFKKDNIRYVKIKCNKDNNIWEAKLSAITRKNGQWCWECCKRNKTKRVDDQKVSDFVVNKGFELLTPPPYTKWGRIKLYCPKHEHQWETSYGCLERKNTNCKWCGHGTPSMSELKEILEQNNVEFIKRLSGKNVSTVRNIILRCKTHNHEWKTNMGAIMIRDRWCYYCKREERKTSYEVIKKAVEGCGGVLISEGIKGSLTKFMVRCRNGHKWETCFDYVNQGYWCPECPYKCQTELHEIIRGLFPKLETHYNYRGFDWLKMNKRMDHRMEIDIWVPDLKLAIEYDGIQHFQPVKFSSKISDEQAKKNLADLKRRDKKKIN